VTLTVLKVIHPAQIPFKNIGCPGWKEEEERSNSDGVFQNLSPSKNHLTKWK
jgi:hypothetical protein